MRRTPQTPPPPPPGPVRHGQKRSRFDSRAELILGGYIGFMVACVIGAGAAVVMGWTP